MLQLHAHMSTCGCLPFSCVFLGFDQFWLCSTTTPTAHIQHISATLCLSRGDGITEETCVLCILYCYTYFSSIPMHESTALIVFSTQSNCRLTSVPSWESAVLPTLSPQTKNSFSLFVSLTLDVQLLCPRVSLAAK